MLRELLEKDGEFQAWEIGATNQDLLKLMRLGIVRITLRTNRNTYWKVVDKEKLKKLIELQEARVELPKTEPLFSSIVGYEEHKELLLRCVQNGQHAILLGKPSLAKTMFLLELTKVGGYYVTNYVTMASLFDILTFSKPKLLLIDGIDTVKDKNVYNFLLNVTQYGIVTKHTANAEIQAKTDVTVIGTANSLKRLPEALVSRFLVIRFKEYNELEYENVVRSLLADKPKELVDKIIEATKDKREVRSALKLARICKSADEVERFKGLIVI